MLALRAALMAAIASGSSIAVAQDALPFPSPSFNDRRAPLEAGGTAVMRDTPVTTIEDAITIAYWTNPTLLAQRSNLRAADTLFPEARSAYGPQIDLRASHGFARDRLETQPGIWRRQQGLSSTAELIFSQSLFSSGRRAASEGAALAEIELGRNQLRLQEAQTMLDVITAYVSVIRDRETVGIAQENLALLDRQYDSSRKRFAVREITATDLQQVETRVEFGRAQLLSAKGQLGASESQFLRHVGALPGELADPSLTLIGVASLEQAYTLVETNSPLIQAAQAREKISRANIAGARAERGPDLSWQGSGAYGTLTPYSNDLRTTEMRSALVLTMPLVDSGARRARIERARQTNDADWRLVDMALRDARQTAAAAWDGHQAARLSLYHYRQATDAAEKAYKGAAVQEKAGMRTTLDVLDLARDLLTVRTSYVSAKANEYIARSSLIAAMGNLEGAALIPSIRAYDPDIHFRQQDGRGDVPLLTYVLSGLDSFVAPDLSSDRAVRDPAGQLYSSPQIPTKE